MRRIYHQSLACLRRYWALYLFLTVVLPVLYGFIGPFALMVYLPFAFILHRHFLFGRSMHSTGGEGAFLGVSIAFMLLGLALNFALQALWPDHLRPWRGPTLFAGQILFHWLILSLFGTLLPCMVSADKYWLLPTIRRMRRTGLWVAAHLAMGPGLFALVAALLIGLLVKGAAPLLGPLSILIIPLGLTFTLLGALTLTVAILCEAYRRVPSTLVDTAA